MFQLTPVEVPTIYLTEENTIEFCQTSAQGYQL